jgi:PhnB protein
MTSDAHGPVISVMLAVPDAAAAARWYARGLGATELWDLGGVVGLTVEGAPFFLGEPANNGWDTPTSAGTRTVRVEVFVDDPDGFIQRAVAAGADGSVDEIRDHEMPWGVHRQGGFLDPFGHLWLVGDRSPLGAPSRAGADQLDEPAGRAPARWPPGRWPGRSRGRPRSPAGPLAVPPPPVGAGDVLPELAWSWRSLATAFVRCGVEVLQIAQGALSSRENAAVGRLRNRLNEGTCGGANFSETAMGAATPRVQIQ